MKGKEKGKKKENISPRDTLGFVSSDPANQRQPAMREEWGRYILK